MPSGTLKLKGDTPWLIDKKKKKKKKKPVGDESQADEGTQDITTAQKPQIVGTVIADGKAIDPTAISVMGGKTYEQEFGYELEKLKKGGETKSVPWGSTVRAPPEILHGYSAPIKPKTASQRLDHRSASRSDKFCK